MCGNSQQHLSTTTMTQNIRNTELNSKTALTLANHQSPSMEEPFSASPRCKVAYFHSYRANFGLIPYVLQVKPIEISLFKDLKKNLVKTFDLNIAGMAFSHLKKAGGSKNKFCVKLCRNTFVLKKCPP